jgi:hypothetical protein
MYKNLEKNIKENKILLEEVENKALSLTQVRCQSPLLGGCLSVCLQVDFLSEEANLQMQGRGYVDTVADRRSSWLYFGDFLGKSTGPLYSMYCLIFYGLGF